MAGGETSLYIDYYFPGAPESEAIQSDSLNTLKLSRRASRAGLLHFPKVLLLFEPKYPKNFPARFARRIASFSYGFCCFLSPNTLKFSRRASRAGLLHFPKVFVAF